MQRRCQKSAGTKISKCLVGCAILLLALICIYQNFKILFNGHFLFHFEGGPSMFYKKIYLIIIYVKQIYIDTNRHTHTQTHLKNVCATLSAKYMTSFFPLLASSIHAFAPSLYHHALANSQ